jgi:replicative DNA helicase
MATQQNNFLTDEFLMDLYYTCLNNDYILALVVEHIELKQLPDRDFQAIHKAIKEYYKKNKKAPSFSVLKQSLTRQRGAMELLDDIADTAHSLWTDDALAQLDGYIRQEKFQQAYKEAGELYNKSGFMESEKRMAEYHEWAEGFSLVSAEFVDVVGSFSTRFKANRQKHNSASKKVPITRFYIDELDSRNNGRNLRGQLTCFLAPSGVGKSHIARWIGKNACQIDGLNVLHIQLEGSEDEVVDAYAASLVSCNSFKYETGTLRDSEVEQMEEMLKEISGNLHVKSYPKFGAHVSTIDVNTAIQDYKKRFGLSPDVVIIDSMDLLTDSSGQHYTEKGERLKRIKVANDLKDLASDENVWMVVTYQSTIENQEWLNDEKNVLTTYNTSEAKGLCRPLTHLITLNQSSREEKENTMRLHVAKSRFFKKGEPFKIATDYEHERFYDSERTMRINRVAA